MESELRMWRESPCISMFQPLALTLSLMVGVTIYLVDNSKSSLIGLS